MTVLKQEIETLVSGYFDWLKGETRLQSFEGDEEIIAITTPHLDRHNDFLQIVVTRDGDNYELSDDGYILDDLEASGCLINTQKRQSILHEMLKGFGVSKERQLLVTHANTENFSYKKHALIQAMLAVNDMFYVSSAHIKSFFFEDVRDWLRNNEIPAIEGANFFGKSGFNHKFEFTIPAFREFPVRYINTVNHPTKQAAQNIIMAWEDTKLARPEGEKAKAYVFLNDQNDKPINKNIPNAFHEYGIEAVAWDNRGAVKENLSLN